MPTVPQFPPSDRWRALGREAICGLLGPSFSLCKPRAALAVSPVPFKAQQGGPDTCFIPGSGSSYPWAS